MNNPTINRLITILLLLLSTTMQAQMLRHDISLSDPAIMADPATRAYYMTGTAGDIFKSTNLEVWTRLPWALQTADIEWIGKNYTSPSSGQIWAPELYYKDGAYYDIVTFTNPNATTEGTNHTRRSIHILKSNQPIGPYRPIPNGDALYLPATKMAIDGTIWEEDGKLYLVYCYEWVQAGDGAIEYIELKQDLSGTIGTSKHICRASDGRAWNTDAVTDGPYLFRTQTGRLGMIWTSWRSGIYVQGVSYSDNGRLDGKWTHSKCPVTPDNHGHGMLFRTFDGQLLMSIHSNRNIDLANQHFERHPELFVVDDSGDELRVVMQYKPTYSLRTPSSVVVLNAGFDYSTAGWICTTDAVNQKVASNQNGAITGSYYESWDPKSFTGDIYQTITVPNGTYRLTAAAFRSHLVEGTNESDDAVCLFANESTTPVTSATPTYYSITVYVSDGKLSIGLRSNRKNYQWMGIDNVSVTYYGEEELDATEIDSATDENVVYLQNVRNRQYLNCGNSWGTQATFSSHAMDLYLVELPNGRYAIDTHINNGGGNHYVGANGYMDGAMAEFRITERDSTFTLSTDGSHYWGVQGNADVVCTTLTSPQTSATRWSIKTRADLFNEMQLATADNPADATFLLPGANFGRNDTRIAASWNGTFETGGDVKNQCAQTPSASYNISHTLTGIPNGFYQVCLQGFYRHGTATSAARSRSRGTERLNAYLYANTVQTPLMSIFDHANHAVLSSVDSDVTAEGTIPSTLSAASAMFTAGLYANNLWVEVTDGTLKLGVKKTTGSTPADNWTVFDNFELYYYGEHAPTVVRFQKDNKSTSPAMYNLQGHPLSDPPNHGMFIVGNKKMFKP